MKILITEFRQESNSLTPVTTDLDSWREAGWVMQPDEVAERLAGSESALGGMVREVSEAIPRARIVFGPSLYSQSGGTAEQAVMEHFWAGLEPVLRTEGPFDAVLCSFHGALQTTEFDDAEAEVARRIREIVGPDCPIAASTDLHGYISEGFIDRVDFICGYHTYPHVDFVETGRRAARLALTAIADRDALHMAWAPIPMIVPASGYDTLQGPFRALFAQADSWVESGVLEDYSIYQMQPWLDVAEPNSAVLTVAVDVDVAMRHAEELARRLYAMRRDFAVDSVSVDEVIDRAEDHRTPKPVILVDSADSGNAGAPGDSMAVADRLLARSSGLRSATVVADADAARRAHDLGVGERATFRLGGAVDPRAVSITAEGYVRSLHDGEFRPEGVGSAGSTVRLGRSAVIRIGTLDVLVCETIAGNGDPQLYRAFGIEPTLYDLVVVKANTSFRVGYAPFAGTICDADTPGAASANISALPFQRLPRTIYPWVDLDDFTPSARPAHPRR